MANRVLTFRIGTALTTTGLVVADLGEITLHGWQFSNTVTAAGVVEFRTHDLTDSNQSGEPVLPTIADDLLFSRSVAISADDSQWFTEAGIYLPGGLFVDLQSGLAVITGSIFYS